MSKSRFNPKLRLTIRVVALILGCLALGWLGFSVFGYQMVESVYEGRSFGFLNRVVEGQTTHDVNYYYTLLKNLLGNITLCGIALCIFALIVYLISLSKEAIALCFGTFLTLMLILCAEGTLTLLKIGEKAIKVEKPSNYHHRAMTRVFIFPIRASTMSECTLKEQMKRVIT